jgi:hypothetical protein
MKNQTKFVNLIILICRFDQALSTIPAQKSGLQEPCHREPNHEPKAAAQNEKETSVIVYLADKKSHNRIKIVYELLEQLARETSADDISCFHHSELVQPSPQVYTRVFPHVLRQQHSPLGN